jgi:hypothetical protein
MKPKEIFDILKKTASDWMEDQAPTLGAALAYYTVFSLAPLLIIAIAIAGLAFGQEAAQGQIFDQLRSLLGEASGKAMQDMVQNANAKPATGLVATLIGVVTHRNEVVCPIILREEERKEAAIVSVSCKARGAASIRGLACNGRASAPSCSASFHNLLK